MQLQEGFISASDARYFLHVTDHTLRKWEKEGAIDVVRKGGKGHRRYNVKKFIESQNKVKGVPEFIFLEEHFVLYARVSSKPQEPELKNQISYLQAKYPNYELITDIGSGLNFKWKGFKTLLEYALEGTLREVVVTYKDRLLRLGFELLELIFTRLSKTKIVVLNVPESSKESELVEDLMSIITVFTAKIHGRRSYSKRKQSKENDKVETITK